MSAAQAQQKICSEWNPVNKNEYRGGIWVYVEYVNGVIKDGSLQLIGKARELAGKISTDVTAWCLVIILATLLRSYLLWCG